MTTIQTLRDAFERYYTTTNHDPRHATREDIARAEQAWTRDQVMRPGSREQDAEFALVREVRRWIVLGIDDVTDELTDAVELFDRRMAEQTGKSYMVCMVTGRTLPSSAVIVLNRDQDVDDGSLVIVDASLPAALEIAKALATCVQPARPIIRGRYYDLDSAADREALVTMEVQ